MESFADQKVAANSDYDSKLPPEQGMTKKLGPYFVKQETVIN